MKVPAERLSVGTMRTGHTGGSGSFVPFEIGDPIVVIGPYQPG